MTLSESVAKAEAAASAAPLPAVLPFSSPCSSSSAAASSSSSSSPCSAPSASSGAPSSSSASAAPAISLVSPQGLAELLQEKAHQVLLLDLRSFMSFNQNQIKSSINVCLPTSLVKRKNFSLNLVESSLSGLEKERFKNRTGRDIILYDNDCKEARKNCLLTSLLDKFQQECHQASVALLDGGFQKFLAAFPQFCLCKAAPSPSPSASPSAAPSALRPHTTSSLPPSHPPFFASFSVPRALPFARPLTPPDSDREPVEIFDFLYVGSHDAATNLETLRKRNINYILNAAKECHDAFTALPGFNYLRLDLLDCASQSIDMHALEQAFQFIDRARSEGAKCLVHCKAGQSRSATIILSYIIRTFRWSLQDAYQFVQRKRPSVSPNLGFIAQLVHFEQATLGTSTSIQRLLCPEATPLTPPHLERASTSVPPPPSPLSELVTIGCK